MKKIYHFGKCIGFIDTCNKKQFMKVKNVLANYNDDSFLVRTRKMLYGCLSREFLASFFSERPVKSFKRLNFEDLTTMIVIELES